MCRHALPIAAACGATLLATAAAAAGFQRLVLCTQVSGLCVRVERYAEQDSYASRLAVSVHDFEVRVPGCTQKTLTGCDLVVWLQSILQLTEMQYECKWQRFQQLKFQRHSMSMGVLPRRWFGLCGSAGAGLHGGEGPAESLAAGAWAPRNAARPARPGSLHLPGAHPGPPCLLGLQVDFCTAHGTVAVFVLTAQLSCNDMHRQASAAEHASVVQVFVNVIVALVANMCVNAFIRM